MAGSGYRDWTAGQVPTAAQFDTFLQEQTVMVFASAAARDTALSTVKSEGMLTYQLDTNAYTMYTGATWSTICYGHGPLPTWTPTVTQLGSVTVTVNTGTYQRKAREVTCRFAVTVTGSGTANNAVTIGGLPFAANTTMVEGIAYLSDVSAGIQYPGLTLWMSTSTTMTMFGTAANANPTVGLTGSGTFALGLASGDFISGTAIYEATADA